MKPQVSAFPRKCWLWEPTAGPFTFLAVKETKLKPGSLTTSLLGCRQVAAYHSHTGAVQDICFDEEVESIGSCSDDGTVVVRGVFTDEFIRINHYRPQTVKTYQTPILLRWDCSGLGDRSKIFKSTDT